ncbi:MAG: ankyrin repeat domain-containing protein [Armatimonadetes bacterium]|nr:ankyrin repeat domain-containing protein [Armatimonadota bacterium]
MSRGRSWLFFVALAAAIVAGCGEPPSESDMIDAVAAGDVAKAKELLASGGFVESRDKRGFTAMGIACLNGDAKMAELLLEHRAGLQSAGSAPEPLGLAVQSGSLETVKVLLDHKAPANGGGLKPAPIGLATTVEMAQLLLSNGADPNGMKEAVSDPPLILAVRRGKLPVVRFLLEHGAKVDATTKQGQTALHQPSSRRRPWQSADSLCGAKRALNRGCSDRPC